MNKYALFGLAASAIVSSCASVPREAAGRTGILAVHGFVPRKGGHCESSAMLNALANLGYDVTEADIAGGGGAPAFMFTAAGFPFIGSRNERMRETFLEAAGIRYGVVRPKAVDDGWRGVFDLLGRGVPALLRVDMRYLPYLYGGKYGPSYMSFGWHVVCIYSVDFDRGVALVTDTERGGPCEIALRDLEKARFSRTKTWPPRGEYAWVEPKPGSWTLDPDALARAALASVLRNYDKPGSWASEGRGAPRAAVADPLAGLAGLAAFPETLACIHRSVNPCALGSAYSYLGDTIERNGTGGAAFRRLFRDFLADRAVDCADPALRTACAALLPRADEAMAAWGALAASFYAAAESFRTATGPTAGTKAGGKGRIDAITAAEEATAARARGLYAAESALRDAIAGFAEDGLY